MSEDHPTPPLPAASGVENYQLGAEISTGGMGSVLEAHDGKLDRTVAIKVMLLEGDASPAMRERFLREARVLAMLAHPNIVPIHDLVWEDGRPLFYSMKRVNGRSLGAILKDLRKEDVAALREYPLDRLLLIFRKICDAVAFAHSKGVLHRDLKPDNIMVGEFGEVLVMDWGLAVVRDLESGRLGEAEIGDSDLSLSPGLLFSSSGVTLHGAVLGTPQYMSPEQASGSIDDVDERSDIYALGGILYAILTLRPPIEGGTALEILEKVSRGEITSPTALLSQSGSRGKVFEKGEVLEAKRIKPLPHLRGGQVPSALSSVAMKALHLDKDRRFPTVTGLSEDVEAYMNGFATRSEEAGAMRQLWLLMRRHKVITSSLAALLVISMGFMVNLRNKERRAAAGEARAIIALADAALSDGNGVRMQELLHSVPSEMRDSTWHYLLDQSDTSVATISLLPAGVSSIAALPRTPGGLAVAQLGGRISFLNVRTGEPLPEFGGGFSLTKPESPPRIAVSPDGERIAIGQWGGKGGLSVRSVRDGREILRWDAPETRNLEFNADGSLLLQRCRPVKTPQRIRIWESATGTLLWEETAFGAFSADGTQLIVSRDGLRVVDARDGKTLRRIPGSFPSTIELAVNRENLLAAYDNRGELVVFDLHDLSIISRFPGAPFRSRDYFMAWMPDRAAVLTAWQSVEGRQIVQLQNPRTGAVVRSFLGGRQGIATAAVHPISGEVVIGLDGLHVWDARDTPTLMKGRSHVVAFLGFLGSDEVIVSYACPENMPSIKRGTQTLWTNRNSEYRFLNVSQNGTVAAIGSGAARWPVLIFERDGEGVGNPHEIVTTLNDYQVRLSPTGDEVALFRDQVERFTRTGEPLPALEKGRIAQFNDIAWRPGAGRVLGLVSMNGPRFSKTSEEHLVLWDAGSGKIIRSVVNPTLMNFMAVTPDGRHVAEAGADAMVRLRDAETLDVVREFRAHDGRITALACHPTKRFLATGSIDLTVRLWNLDTGELLEELRGPIQPPTKLIFSPGGGLLACAAANDESRLWQPTSLQSKTDL